MDEQPILMSGQNGQRCKDGTKTMTRRIMHPQPVMNADGKGWTWQHKTGPIGCASGDTPSIYGKYPPGSRLWVREEHYQFGHWEPVDGVLTKGGRQKWKFVADRDEVLFDAPESFRKARNAKDPSTPAWHKRLARFMPRRFARTILEVVSETVERVQEISEADCVSEGMDGRCTWAGAAACNESGDLVVNQFASLWHKINGPGSWEANPFVWVIEFRRVA